MATEKTLRVVVGARTSDFDKAMHSLQRDLRKFSRDMTTIGRDLSMKVTAPLVGLGVASFKVGKDFESSMSKIVGLVGVAQDQVDAWGKELLTMGPALGKGPKELADALFFVTSAGIRGKEAMDVLEQSAKASVAGLGETKTIADLVTSAVNAYGVENLNAAQATDILVAAVREGKAEAPALAASLGSVLPMASELGVTFDQIGAAMAGMTRTGTNAAEASTQLSGIFTAMLKPSKQANDELAKYGLTAQGLRNLLREEGLIVLLQTLKETFGDNEEAMAKIFPNVRALRGVLDLMGANAADNIQIFDSLKDSTGALDKAFEAAADTAEFKFQRALAQGQASLIGLWEVLEPRVIPVIEKATDKVGELTNWFMSLDPATQQNIVTMAAWVAAVGPAVFIAGTLAGTVNNLISLFKILGGAKLIGSVVAGFKTITAVGIAAAAPWIALAAAIGGAIYYLDQWGKRNQDMLSGFQLGQGTPDPAMGGTTFTGLGNLSNMTYAPSTTLPKAPSGGMGSMRAAEAQTVNHTGTITVKGVNDKGELVGIVETTVQDVLRREARR